MSNQGTHSLWRNPQILAELKKLVVEGLSASQIGAALGCSRNAVIGKCARLRLTLGSGRTKPMRVLVKGVSLPPAPKRRAPVERKEPTRIYDPADIAGWTGTGGAVEAIDGRNRGECRYPLGSPAKPDFHFCSEPVDPAMSTSYCTRHHELCHSRTLQPG